MKHRDSYTVLYLPCKLNYTTVGLALAIRKPCGLCIQETRYSIRRLWRITGPDRIRSRALYARLDWVLLSLINPSTASFVRPPELLHHNYVISQEQTIIGVTLRSSQRYRRHFSVLFSLKWKGTSILHHYVLWTPVPISKFEQCEGFYEGVFLFHTTGGLATQFFVLTRSQQ